MKRFINYLIILFVGVLFIPNVFAASIEFGGFKDKASTVTVPVEVKLAAGETLNKVELACKVQQVFSDGSKAKNNNLKCSVASAVDSADGNWQVKEENGKTFFIYAKTETTPGEGEEAEPVTTTTGYVASEETTLHIADIVVENKSSSTLQAYLTLDIANFNDNNINVEAPGIFEMKAFSSAVSEESSDSRLKTLKFSQGTLYPKFSPDVTEYTLYNIAETVNSTTYDYECNAGKSKCSITITGIDFTGPRLSLKDGLNTVTFTVKSQKATSTVYKINIYRGKTTFNSAKLATLSFGDYKLTPVFNPDVTDYSITVPNKVNNLMNVMVYTPEDDKADVPTPTGVDNLKVGANTLKITVNSASKEETIIYKITVNRLSADAVEVTKYINNEVTYKGADGIEETKSQADFKALYPDVWKLIEDGTYKFDKDGNITTGEETPGEDAPGEEETENKDDDDKDEDKNEKTDKKIYLIIGLIALGLLVIIIAGLLIFRKKKDDDAEEDSQDDDSEDGDDEEESDEAEESETEEDNGPIGEDFSDDVNKTVDVDVALSDLMSTKQYEFNFDEDEEEVKEDEE